jgi:hypothetical protein
MDTDARAIGGNASCVRDSPCPPLSPFFFSAARPADPCRYLVANAIGPVKSQAPIMVILNIKT